MEMNCKEILEAVRGRLNQTGDLHSRVEDLSIDSRQVKAGDFFVPLAGERVDGHHFLNDAALKGAIGCFIQAESGVSLPENMTIIGVTDTLRALQKLAAAYRNKFTLPVVAVTGSTGKTTTKDLIAAVLSSRLQTLKTEGNLNNHIGVPLMLARIESSHQAAVLEMGMSGRGEIDLLARIAHPLVGVITNIGESHLEMLGSREEIARAKCELLPHLPENGMAVLNADEPLLEPYSKELRSALVTFGFSAGAMLRCTAVKQHEGKKYVRLEQSGYPSMVIEPPLPGKHNVYNLMAAVAVGRTLGLTEEEITVGLQNILLSGMRLEIIKTSTGLNVINDAYNASPSSVAAALDVLEEMAGNQGKIAVLGDMLELGPLEAEGHLGVGRLAAKLNLNALILFGDRARLIAVGAQEAGYPAERIYHSLTHEEAAKRVNQTAKTGDWILLKGSRGMRMENVLAVLSEGKK